MDNSKLNNKIDKILASENNDLLKKIKILAVITKVLEEINVKPIIVGGQAVEFYTSGGYTTMDIDIICQGKISEIDSKLKSLGFEKEGKYWILKNSDIAIEIPSGPLAGNREKITEVEVEEGLKTYFIGIEDLIIDRLNSYKYWNINSDKEWIIGMMYINYDNIDWDYLFSKAKKEGTQEEVKKFKNLTQNKLQELNEEEKEM